MHSVVRNFFSWLFGGQRTYVVKKGDTLSHIAKDLLGDGNEWQKIYAANRDKVKDPDLIYPGQVLRIPRRTK